MGRAQGPDLEIRPLFPPLSSHQQPPLTDQKQSASQMAELREDTGMGRCKTGHYTRLSALVITERDVERFGRWIR